MSTFTINYEPIQKKIEVGDYVISNHLRGRNLSKDSILNNRFMFQVESLKDDGTVHGGVLNNKYTSDNLDIISKENYLFYKNNSSDLEK